jgi:hypothetical protein
MERSSKQESIMQKIMQREDINENWDSDAIETDILRMLEQS